MRKVIEYFIDNPAVTWVMTGIFLVGGMVGLMTLSQLEDPVFTVKKGIIITEYPGATPEEVELEVTDRLEKALWEVPQLKDTLSYSRAGVSYIKIEVKDEYWEDRLPQVWDEIRKKLRDTAPLLPPGAGKPDISDDFSFVYGYVLAVTGDGYTYAELEDYADFLKKDLSLMDGVARVELWGVQDEVIYVDISEKQLSEWGLNSRDIDNTLQLQNAVVDAGYLEVGDQRIRIAPTGRFQKPEDIGDLLITPVGPGPPATVAGQPDRSIGIQTHYATPESTRVSPNRELIRIRDVAKVTHTYLEPPQTLMRYNGQRAVGIKIAADAGSQGMVVGAALDEVLEKIAPTMPVGLEVAKVSWQSDLIEDSILGMGTNVILAVIIVLLVLIIPSGFRMGMVIAINLMLTIITTFMFMKLFGMALERMSLGALIIAMGMMVDNAIVISDGIAVKMRQGMARRDAAIATSAQNAYPLFTATVIAVMAFFPIFASTTDAGEYARSLFTVIAISLLFSWFQAIYFTPLQCMKMLPEPKIDDTAKGGGEAPRSEYDNAFFNAFRWLLYQATRFRFFTIAAMVALLAISIANWGKIPQMFFPNATRTQLMVDYWAPEGTRIQDTSENLKKIEEKLLQDERVSNVSLFIGSGPPRFYLPVDPELQYPSYAEFVLNFENLDDIDAFVVDTEPWIKANVPEALTRLRRYSVGPSDTWKFEARFSGPAEADLDEMRAVAEEAMEIVKASPYGREVRHDMRQPVKKVVPVYDQQRGRWIDVNRKEVANTTKMAFDGRPIGLYRQGDDLMPIYMRYVDEERRNLARDIDGLQVQPTNSNTTIPLSAITTDIRGEWEESNIVRWNRRRAVTVQASPIDTATFPTLRDDVIDEINAMELPSGYHLFWDGEFDSERIGTTSLVPGAVVAAVLLVFLVVTVFNGFRPLLIILLTIPMAFIGVVGALFIFDTPFGFLGILGALSLAGMMNKNIVVLLDAVSENLEQGMDKYRAITEATVTRIRPVLLAAMTTALGVVPIIPDIFWKAMAVTIMGGLTFGSMLTLVMVPVFWVIFYQTKTPKTLPKAS